MPSRDESPELPSLTVVTPLLQSALSNTLPATLVNTAPAERRDMSQSVNAGYVHGQDRRSLPITNILFVTSLKNVPAGYEVVSFKKFLFNY